VFNYNEYSIYVIAWEEWTRYLTLHDLHKRFVLRCTYSIFNYSGKQRKQKNIENAVNMRYNSHEVSKMSNTTYNVRINKNVREEADALYRSMGLTLSSAINLFLTQSVIQGKLPINEIIAEQSYATILLRDAAEVDDAIANGTTTIYTTPEELFKAWENEA